MFNTIYRASGLKGISLPNQNYISPIHWPLTFLFLLMLAGIIALVIRWIIFPGDRSVLLVVGGWAVFNFMLVSIAYRSVAERQQRRASPRIAMDVPAEVWLEGMSDQKDEARITDASTSGVGLLLPAGSQGVKRAYAKGSEVWFFPQIPNAPRLKTPVLATVMSVETTQEGVILGALIAAEQPVAARETVAFLIFGNSENWRNMRQATRAPKGFIAGLLYTVWLFLRGLPLLLRDLVREPKRRAVRGTSGPQKGLPVHLLAFGVDIEQRNEMLAALRDAQVVEKKG